MTSTSLHNNKLKSAFGSLFKRNWLAILLSAAISLICGLVVVESTLAGYSLADLEKTGAQFGTAETAYIVESIFNAAVLACGAISFVLQAAVYRETYSKRASDWLFSLPVKRETFFNAAVLLNILSVAIYYIIGVAVFLGTFSSSFSAWSKYFTVDVSWVIQYALMSFLISVGTLAVCSLAAVLSGKIWHYLVICSVVFMVLPSLGSCAVTCMNSIWGFYSSALAGEIIVPSFGMMLCYEEQTVSAAVLCVLLIAQILAVYIFGLAAFKKRKAEIAEMAVFGKIVIALACVVTAAYGFLQTYLLAQNLNKAVGVILSAAAAFFAGILCACVLTLTKKRFVKLGAVSAGAAVVVSAIFVLAVNYVPNISYKSYVPAADEVAEVRVQEDDYGYGYGSNFDNVFRLLFYGWSDAFNYDRTLQGDEAKACVEALHKVLVSSETEEASRQLEAVMDSNETDWYDSMQWIKLEYTLKDGSVVKRTYYADAGKYYAEIAALEQTEESLSALFPTAADKDSLLFLSFDSREIVIDDGVTYINDFVTFDDFTPFIDAVRKARQNESIAGFLANNTDIYPSENFFSEFYETSSTYSITIFYIGEDATDEEIAKLKSMTPYEIYSSYYSYEQDAIYYSWADYSNLPIETWYITLTAAEDDCVMQLLNSQGIWSNDADSGSGQ